MHNKQEDCDNFVIAVNGQIGSSKVHRSAGEQTEINSNFEFIGAGCIFQIDTSESSISRYKSTFYSRI
jgi:hypothetical protein